MISLEFSRIQSAGTSNDPMNILPRSSANLGLDLLTIGVSLQVLPAGVHRRNLRTGFGAAPSPGRPLHGGTTPLKDAPTTFLHSGSFHPTFSEGQTIAAYDPKHRSTTTETAWIESATHFAFISITIYIYKNSYTSSRNGRSTSHEPGPRLLGFLDGSDAEEPFELPAEL